jgi:hypothetical protein
MFCNGVRNLKRCDYRSLLRNSNCCYGRDAPMVGWLDFSQSQESQMSRRSSGHGGGANRRNVTPSGNGDWAVNRPGASRVSSVHPTQSEAIQRAREALARDGGGELTIHGRNGRIRDSDTVAPGHDPNPPKDSK